MSAAPGLETALRQRSDESGLPVDALRAVYLRGVREVGCHGGPQAGLDRVDAFVVHTLTRDTHYPQDRDLAVAALPPDTHHLAGGP